MFQWVTRRKSGYVLSGREGDKVCASFEGREYFNALYWSIKKNRLSLPNTVVNVSE